MSCRTHPSPRFPLLIRSAWVLAAFIAGAFPAHAQTHTPDTVDITVLRVVTDSFPVISTYFRAEKAGGGPMPSFHARDLRIQEDGSPAEFLSLRPVADQTPVHLALVMDRSSSMMDEFLYRWDTVGRSLVLSRTALRRPGEPYPFEQARSAVGSMGEDMRIGLDGILLITFSDRVDPIRPMQWHPEAIRADLSALRARGSTAYYDALMAALDSLPRYGGLRAIVALTDGTDNASKATAADVVRRAQASQTPLYLVGLGNVARDTMLHMASATRGACYFLDHGSLLGPVYRDINRRVRSVYAAAYRSPHPPVPGRTRHVEVRLRGDSLCMRGHASRYEVPASVAVPWHQQQNMRRLAWALVMLAAVGVLTWVLSRRRGVQGTPDRSALPSLPELLPPPRAFPNPSTGPLTVRIDLSGDAPSGYLFVTDTQGQVLRQYTLSGHQAWLDIDLGGLPAGNFLLRITDGRNLSLPAPVSLVR